MYPLKNENKDKKEMSFFMGSNSGDDAHIRGMIMLAQANVMDFRSPVNETPDIALRGIWKDFIGSIAGIGKGIYNTHSEMSSVLNHNLVLMHTLLMSTSIYRENVNSSFQRMARSKYWGWKTVYEDSLGKAGLFSIYDNAPVPLHDHPGSRGAIMVIEGEVEVDRYDLHESSRHHQGSGVVELERYDTTLLKPFDITWFGKDEGNIHGMRAVSGQCVMLKVQLMSVDAGDRSWYFPIAGADQDEGIVPARRIMSQYL